MSNKLYLYAVVVANTSVSEVVSTQLIEAHSFNDAAASIARSRWVKTGDKVRVFSSDEVTYSHVSTLKGLGEFAIVEFRNQPKIATACRSWYTVLPVEKGEKRRKVARYIVADGVER